VNTSTAAAQRSSPASSRQARATTSRGVRVPPPAPVGEPAAELSGASAAMVTAALVLSDYMVSGAAAQPPGPRPPPRDKRFLLVPRHNTGRFPPRRKDVVAGSRELFSRFHGKFLPCRVPLPRQLVQTWHDGAQVNHGRQGGLSFHGQVIFLSGFTESTSRVHPAKRSISWRSRLCIARGWFPLEPACEGAEPTSWRDAIMFKRLLEDLGEVVRGQSAQSAARPAGALRFCPLPARRPPAADARPPGACQIPGLLIGGVKRGGMAGWRRQTHPPCFEQVRPPRRSA